VPLDPAVLFERPGPVHVEIGSGKGTFLLAEARAHPDRNFLGIEWANKYYRYAVDRMGRWGLTNVRLIRTDAGQFIGRLAEGSVEFFHVYFPDPWPKKRHHKRRFFQAGNLEQVWRVLRDGGILQFVTDHADYFRAAEEVLAGQADRWQSVAFYRPAGAGQGELVGTNYERKYLVERRNIHALAIAKRSTLQ